jgi:mono/diheme cytochrome c family protein
VISKCSIIFPALLSFAAITLHANPVDQTNTNEQAGALLFRDKGCAHCHGEGGVGAKKGPAIVDINKDPNWPPAKITDRILNGGQKMPPFRDSLTDDEVAQIVAYLRAKVKPAPPPAAPGAAPPAPTN